MSTLHAWLRALGRRDGTPPQAPSGKRQERLAQNVLYGGRRTIDVAPTQAPASITSSRRAADGRP